MTKAELKRILTPGTKLVLVNCLMGPCHKPRTVKQVRSHDIIMETPEGKNSYMTLESNEYVERTEKGFRVMLKAEEARPGQPAHGERLMTEYVFTGVTCKDCQKDVPELEVFPGPRCLSCHAKLVDSLPLVRPDFTKVLN